MCSPKPSHLCVSWTDRLPASSRTTPIPSTQLMASFLVKFFCLPSYNFPLIPHELDFSLCGEEGWPWNPIALYLPTTNTYSQGNSYLPSSQHHNLNVPANWIVQDVILWNKHQLKAGRKLGHGWGGYGSHGFWTKGAKSQRSLRDFVAATAISFVKCLFFAFIFCIQSLYPAYSIRESRMYLMVSSCKGNPLLWLMAKLQGINFYQWKDDSSQSESSQS